MGPTCQRGNVFFTKYRGPSGGSQLSGGRIIVLRVIRRHFLACEDIAGGSDMSAGGTFFREIQRPFRWVPAVRWRNHYFARTVHGRWMWFVDHVDQAAPRAPWRWTTARPRKGATRSRGRRGSGCPRGEEYASTSFFRGRIKLSRPTSVWQRIYSPFPICKNVRPIFKF